MTGKPWLRRGSMLMEFVLVMPLLFIMIMLVLQFAQVWMVKQVMSYAAFCAARSTICVNEAYPADAQHGAETAAKRVLAWVNFFGTGGSKGVKVPGWGEIPESAGIDRRVTVYLNDAIPEIGYPIPGARAAQVVFNCPLLIPIAGQMVSWYAQHTYADGDAEIWGWTGKQCLLPGEGVFPYIRLRKTCILPLPYSTANLPVNAYDWEVFR